ncbi:hypothetical protein F4809DRAFT_348381 [Biscogniauxia mediterranea]|nr:hypothetical protein F4809DRAFT_348381 [Biscogniauxia mediterranea]
MAQYLPLQLHTQVSVLTYLYLVTLGSSQSAVFLFLDLLLSIPLVAPFSSLIFFFKLLLLFFPSSISSLLSVYTYLPTLLTCILTYPTPT